jgi:hypothetical protein
MILALFADSAFAVHFVDFQHVSGAFAGQNKGRRLA